MRRWHLCVITAVALLAILPGCTSSSVRADLTEQQQADLGVAEATRLFNSTRRMVIIAHSAGLISDEDLVGLDQIESPVRAAIAEANENPTTSTLRLVDVAVAEFERQFHDRSARHLSSD